MNEFLAAFQVELLKARRSRLAWGITAAFMIMPLVSGLFMVILKNPEQARALGLISVKAQLAGGTADWPTFFSMLLQGTAIGGIMLYSFITAWIFGREFSDHTVKEFLAVPTPRWKIIAAKFALMVLWIVALTLVSFAVALAIGAMVAIPGWSQELGMATFGSMTTIMVLLLMLMPPVAFFASAGRGYLPPLGWAVLTLVLAQIVAVLGWGDWFPWSVPAMASGMAGPPAEQTGPHSYLVVLLVCIVGLAATFIWWRSADQAQ